VAGAWGAAQGVAEEGHGEEGHVVVHVVVHAVHFAIGELRIRQVLVALEVLEPEDLCMDQDSGPGAHCNHLADLEVVGDLVIAEGCSLHLVVVDCMGHGNHHDRLGCLLCHPEVRRHRVGAADIEAVVDCIRTEGAVVGGLMGEDLEEVVVVVESCTAARQPLLEDCPVAERTPMGKEVALQQRNDL